MRFSDRLVRCEACGVEFVYTVREQRKRAEKGQPADPPSFCKGCRAADVRLAEAAGQDVEPPEVFEAPEVFEPPEDVEAPEVFEAPEGFDAPGDVEAPEAPGSPPSPEARQPEVAAPSSDGDRPAGKPQPEQSGHKKRRKGGQQRGRRGGGKGQRRQSQKKAPRQTELRIRQVGTVKWFDEVRGYGFIAQDDGEELFVHTSGVLGPSGRALEQGQQVEYEIEHTKRGLQAVDVIQLP